MSHIGLHVDGLNLQIASLKKTKGNISITSLKEETSLLNDILVEKKFEITAGLSCKNVLLRTIQIPLKKKTGYSSDPSFSNRKSNSLSS